MGEKTSFEVGRQGGVLEESMYEDLPINQEAKALS